MAVNCKIIFQKSVLMVKLRSKVCLFIRKMQLVAEYIHTSLACPDSSPSKIPIFKQ